MQTEQTGTPAAAKAYTPATPEPGTSYSVTLVPIGAVFEQWDTAAPLIMAALNVGEMTLEEIKEGIEAGSVVVCQMMKGTELVGIGTLQLLNTQFRGEFRKMLNIITVTGHAIEQARGPFIEFCEKLARAEGCDGVMLKGRKGWTGKLKPFGFRIEYTTMARMF